MKRTGPEQILLSAAFEKFASFQIHAVQAKFVNSCEGMLRWGSTFDGTTLQIKSTFLQDKQVSTPRSRVGGLVRWS